MSHTNNNIEKRKKQFGLAIGALGIVYGDIGTSPLYAFRECFVGVSGFPTTPENILGILSLIVWSLISIITCKYLLLVLRADNQGEGGILALTHLILGEDSKLWKKKHWVLVSIGLFGAALLYGDGIITPSLSVLSAMEGLKVATPIFEPYVVPFTVVILTALFFFQKKGTAGIGKLFGPIALVWFLVLGILGIFQILKYPGVFAAFNPMHAIYFFQDHGFHGTLILGAVFLVVTGGEALYADLGHFGKRAIRLSWFCIVLPGLLLNYFGQGALLLTQPTAISNPFYLMAPQWALIPLVLMATIATIIASQAVISGVFSLTTQAVYLDYLPRTRINHTSAHKKGQIYVPTANWLLFIGTILLVLNFRSSGKLADAYGIAVCFTMIITSFLCYFVMTQVWNWSKIVARIVLVLLLSIELSFAGAIVLKIAHGGWIPLSIAAAIYLTMIIWRRGQMLLEQRVKKRDLNLDNFLNLIKKMKPQMTKGAVVYLVKDMNQAPLPLFNKVKENKSIYEKTFLLHVNQCSRPYMNDEAHYRVETPLKNLYLVYACFGFMETPDLQKLLEDMNKELKLKLKLKSLPLILSKESLIVTNKPGMPRWAKNIYAFMHRNALRITRFFKLESKQVVEIDPQVEI